MSTARAMRILLPALVGVGLSTSAQGITLETALTRTVENSPAIREARARLEVAAGRRIVLRAISLPDARVLVPAGVQGGKRAGEDTVQPFAFSRGIISQPLFHAAIPAAYRRGNIEVLLAQQRLNLAVTQQLHAVRVAYYTAAHNDSMQTLGEAQRQRLTSNVAAQSDRYEAGTADRAALKMAQLLEQEMNPRLEESRRIQSSALLTLDQAIGRERGAAPLRPASNLQFAPVQVNAEREIADALANRPDLQIARLLVRAAEEDQRMIEAAYYPAIGVNISGDYIPATEIRRGNEGSGSRTDDIISSELRYGLGYTWRVVDNGLVRGAAQRQQAVREMNEVVLARLEAEVPRELLRLQTQLRALQARHEALTRAAASSQKAVTEVQGSLAEGLSSQLDYRTAESSYLESTAGVLTVAFEQQLALAEWDRATGRYLRFGR